MKRLFIFLLWTIVAGFPVGAGEWPRYRGPNGDGTATAAGLFGDEIILERLWMQPLGSGFSGIVVGDGKLYTMHVAGKMDALSCFDTSTGKKLWSFRYGPTFPKVGGSEPGPLSTPVLDGNTICGLGARGELFCLEADSGKQIWFRNLVKELGAEQPWCGMTTSPLISEDRLILNLGDHQDKATAAFHKHTGALAWHIGEEKISFQSPSLTTLMGRQQVVSLSETKMRGIDAVSGRLLWERDSKNWIQMTAIGNDRMLAGHAHGFSLYHMVAHGEELQIKELWNNHNLNLEYDMPVHHMGYLYGFKGYFVTCLKLQTGEVVWQHPLPGAGMGILVNGHLATITDDGSFQIGKVSRQGYEPRASIKIFSKSGITEPSYAHGVFYFRNHTHLAAVRVNQSSR